MMLKLMSRGRSLTTLTKLANNQLKSIENSNHYATSQTKMKEDEATNEKHDAKIYHDEPKIKEKVTFEPNLFMNDIETLNFLKKEPEGFKEFCELPRHKRFLAYGKALTKNVIGFIRGEIFGWHFFENDKYIEDGALDCFWEFKSKDDIKGWLTVCDRDMNRGFSTANLDVNKNGRLVFSGYLNCDKLPEDGIHEHTGYAHLSSPIRKSGFGVESYYSWSGFNHLVMRFRGDGRVYRILIRSISLRGLQNDSFYEYFLYTRGGPYWQIAKIPFSKFMLCYQGRIQEKPAPFAPAFVQSFAITLNKYTGPYRLEISHIGMQLDLRNYQEFDYETYFRPEIL